jgi:hypothetical protein
MVSLFESDSDSDSTPNATDQFLQKHHTVLQLTRYLEQSSMLHISDVIKVLDKITDKLFFEREVVVGKKYIPILKELRKKNQNRFVKTKITKMIGDIKKFEENPPSLTTITQQSQKTKSTSASKTKSTSKTNKVSRKVKK